MANIFSDAAFIWQMVNNVVLFIIAIGVLNFVMRGFFWPFLIVKMSLGKRVLVRCHSVTRKYFRTGKIDGYDLIYKVNRKEKKRLNIPKDKQVFYSCLGVQWVDVDEDTNAFLTSSFEGVQGFDAVKEDALLERALFQPQISDMKPYFTGLLVGIGIIAVGMIAIALFLYSQSKDMSVLKNMIPSLQSSIEALKASIGVVPE